MGSLILPRALAQNTELISKKMHLISAIEIMVLLVALGLIFVFSGSLRKILSSSNGPISVPKKYSTLLGLVLIGGGLGYFAWVYLNS